MANPVRPYEHETSTSLIELNAVETKGVATAQPLAPYAFESVTLQPGLSLALGSAQLQQPGLSLLSNLCSASMHELSNALDSRTIEQGAGLRHGLA